MNSENEAIIIKVNAVGLISRTFCRDTHSHGRVDTARQIARYLCPHKPRDPNNHEDRRHRVREQRHYLPSPSFDATTPRVSYLALIYRIS